MWDWTNKIFNWQVWQIIKWIFGVLFCIIIIYSMIMMSNERNIYKINNLFHKYFSDIKIPVIQ